MARVALIDGDSFAYRIAAAVEKTRYLVRTGHAQIEEYATHKEAVAAIGPAASESGQIWSRKEVGTLKEAADILEHSLERSIARGQCSVFHVYLGGLGPTFRDHISRLKRYKGNRNGIAPPTYLSDMRQYLTRYWGALTTSGEEVDDVLSYTARELLQNESVPVIVGNDKDLDQIPGDHYDWVRDERYTVSDAQARLRLWVQVLSGDVADNIGGCWKVGISKASRTVRECIEEYKFDDAALWHFVCEAYRESQEHDGCPYVNLDPVEVALENYNLVRLRQSRHENHEYRGLFVKEKRASTAGKSTQRPASASSAGGEKGECSTESSSSLPIEARGDGHRELGEERSSV